MEGRGDPTSNTPQSRRAFAASPAKRHRAHTAFAAQPTTGVLRRRARLCGPGMIVTDEEALRAVALAWRHLRIVLEPGGAVALAAALFHHAGDVCAVASGGNVDAGVFAQALATL